MIEILGGMVGGLGLFFVGMWFLTENLNALVSHRLRMIANRWTGNRFSGCAWGMFSGAITQSSSALTFIVVSMLRSGLISTSGAFAILVGGNVGMTLLVLVVTFDIKLAALYVFGITSALIVSEKTLRYRSIAASFFGGAMIIFGIVLLKESAAPLADQPWFGEMVDWTKGSLLLAFLVAALLTCIVQSSTAVCVFGISMTTLGVITIDQAIMFIYGSCSGASLILYLLSTGLTGRSRQVAMYQVAYNLVVCAVLVPLLYIELNFDVPLMKALAFSINLDLGQQLAFVFIFFSLLSAPFMLAALGPSARLSKRLWPATQEEEWSKTKFIYDHASRNIDTSLVLVDLEQRRVLEILSQYFEAVRQETSLETIRKSTRSVLSQIGNFLSDLNERHPMQNADDYSSMLTRQKLLYWLEEELTVLCETLQNSDGQLAGDSLRISVREGIDAVLLILLDALENGDEDSWAIAKNLTEDRSDLMHKMRNIYWELEPPLDNVQRTNVLTITNSVEQVFFLLTKLTSELDHRDRRYANQTIRGASPDVY